MIKYYFFSNFLRELLMSLRIYVLGLKLNLQRRVISKEFCLLPSRLSSGGEGGSALAGLGFLFIRPSLFYGTERNGTESVVALFYGTERNC